MMVSAAGFHRAASRSQAWHWLWSLAFARVLVLLTLFLLPVQMRAGAPDAHPHALLTLLLDLRDGELDHHAGDGHEPAVGADHSAQGSDLPDYGKSNVAGSVALLAATIVLLVIPSTRRERTAALAERWQGRIPSVEPPPPRGFAA